MVKKFLISLLAILCLSTNVVYCDNQTNNVDNILSTLEQQDKTTKNLQADYFQTITYLSTNEQLKSEGIFKYKKQNYIYLEQKAPTKQFTYIDGKNITTYVPENRQAIVEKWKDVLNADMILTSIFKFVNSWKTLKKDYIIDLKEETKVDYTFSIQPKDTKEKWNMTITISKSTSQIITTSFNNGNFIIDIKLTNYKLNNNFSNNIFKFVAPKNIDVIQL